MKKSQNNQRGIIYFDGGCQFCRREIGSLKLNACPLEFVDIHRSNELPGTRRQLLQQLHAVTNTGKVLTGFDANLFMWRHGHYAWLAHFLSLPLIYQCTKLMYNAWAKQRYKKLYGSC